MNPYKQNKYVIVLDNSSPIHIHFNLTHSLFFVVDYTDMTNFQFLDISNCIYCALCLYYDSIFESCDELDICVVFSDFASIYDLIFADRTKGV